MNEVEGPWVREEGKMHITVERLRAGTENYGNC